VHLKRALQGWLRAQYQRRAEEAASDRDRVIERIRKSKTKKTLTRNQTEIPAMRRPGGEDRLPACDPATLRRVALV
jgi:hypothetical protein